MPELLASLVTFAVVATLSPGGATTLAAASGTRFGFQRSIPLLAGLVLGVATLIGFVAGGLGSLLLAWSQLELFLRLVGSAYLLWLAWTIARSGAPNAGPETGPDGDVGAAPCGQAVPIGFVAGFALLWVNPKGWTMAVAAAGAYADLSDSPIGLGSLMGAVFGAAAMLSLVLWCAGGSWLSRRLKTPRRWRIANTLLGLLLVASVVPMWL